MKCGTTALKHVLRRHPEIFVPLHEVHYFNYDDVLQHPDFFIWHEQQWKEPTLLKQEEIDNWHARWFEAAAPGQVLGEDSPTVLASPCVMPRMAAANPGLKWIILLRNPVHRTYSNYWHLVRTARTQWSFENALQFQSHELLSRSFYLEQFVALFQSFPREQVFVALFEDWATNAQRIVADILDFLDVPGDSELLCKEGTRFHRASVPRLNSVRLLGNAFLRQRSRRPYRGYLPCHMQLEDLSNSLVQKGVDWTTSRLAFTSKKRPPPMLPQTSEMLTRLFKKRLNGLDDVIGLPAMARWFSNA